MAANLIHRLGRAASRAARNVVIGVLRAYRILVSPWLGDNCRFDPSCSVYAMEAIERFGVVRGIALAVKRILRCHPWGPSGYDPVPDLKTRDDTHA